MKFTFLFFIFLISFSIFADSENYIYVKAHDSIYQLDPSSLSVTDSVSVPQSIAGNGSTDPNNIWVINGNNQDDLIQIRTSDLTNTSPFSTDTSTASLDADTDPDYIWMTVSNSDQLFRIHKETGSYDNISTGR